MEDRMNLDDARQEIGEIDRQMAELFERRLDYAARIGAWKKAHGLPVRDRAQEDRVVERNTAFLKDPAKRGLYLGFIRKVMHCAREYEHRVMDGNRVAYSGVEGAFAQIAAGRIFPGAQLVACPSFEEAYRAVEEGRCECAVLPIENSRAGEVGQVMDLMFEGPLSVNGVYDLAVEHCLLGTGDAVIDNVRTVISHPQALSQCRPFLVSRGLESVEAVNTAVAARMVAEKGDASVAAIASEETASLYGLKILEKRINESRSNTTRFAAFSAEPAPEAAAGRPGRAFLLLFTVRDETGGLASAVNVISRRGFNMRVLRSRPVKSLPWHYYFYAEVEGDETSEAGQALLKELRETCTTVKLAGRYTAAVNSLQGGESI